MADTDFSTDLSFDEIPIGIDMFKYQFPAGLPFGISKPEFAITADKGLQRLHFELKPNMGILIDSVYPNFTFRDLEKVIQSGKLSTDNIKRLLFNMNQTKAEKEFFREYALRFQMAQRDVPVLVPQAWVQWHSMSKRDLRGEGSTIADELYRIDFVAFWNHRRYAILIDDISHYGRLEDRTWVADEESYAKRLKEDRKLRRERWQVFRVGNWEIKNHEGISEILDDLRELMDFE